MDAPPPLKPAPQPLTGPLTGGTREDRYVPAWFPASLHINDLHDRAHHRFVQYCKYDEIRDPVARQKYLLSLDARPATPEFSDDEDIDSSGSDEVPVNVNDSPPRPRKLQKRQEPDLDRPKKKNNNAKRARTLRRRQNQYYARVYEALEPLRHEFRLSDKKFCALLFRYRTALVEAAIDAEHEYNESLK